MDNAVRHMNPYRETAHLYRNAFWKGVITLPYREKHPPPTGYTGHKAPYPDLDKIKEWMSDGVRHNIGLRLAGVDKDHEIIGIDVDHYKSGEKDKKGGIQLKELEDTLGVLPDTWISSSRKDGISGIRYYRVPRGLAFRGQIAKDIECISKGYRFAAVWPSVHPSGETYWWFPPGIRPDEAGREMWSLGSFGMLPKAVELPLLPEKWIEYLTQGRMAADIDDRIDMDSTVDEVYQWADDTFYDDEDTEMCPLMVQKVEKQIYDIENEATSHDKIVKAHYNILRLAAEGHLGYVKAINKVESVWVQDVIERDKRGREELSSEVWRSRTNALRKIKASVDERIKIGATPVDPRCDGPGGVCGHGAGDGGDPDDPLTDVPRGPIKPAGEYRLNDDGNADHFVDMYSSLSIGPSVRFASGYGWIVWHEGKIVSDIMPKWQLDIEGNQEMRRMFQKVRDKQEQYSKVLRQDFVTKAMQFLNQTPGISKLDVDSAKSKWQEWKKFATQNGNCRNANNAIEAVKSINGVSIDVNKLDSNPYLLGVANGVVELDNENVIVRPAKAEDYVTLNTNIEWDTSKVTDLAKKTWQEYLDTFIPDLETQKAVQIALGHCIIGGNPEKKIICLWGPPNTGKSTLITALQAALGDYCSTVNQSVFQNHKLNPILADALPKRIIVCSEFDERDELSASMVKRLTGGHDEVRTEKKNSNAEFSGIPQFVPILATNEVPRISGADKALENRLYPIPLTITPQRIDKKSANLIKAICGPVVLDWLIKGFIEYRRIGEIPVTKEMEKSRARFMSELDEFATFANECLEIQIKPMEYVTRMAMYECFKRWWSENNFQENKIPSMPVFCRRLKSLGYESKDTKIRVQGKLDRWWEGVKLRRGRASVTKINIDNLTVPEKVGQK